MATRESDRHNKLEGFFFPAMIFKKRSFKNYVIFEGGVGGRPKNDFGLWGGGGVSKTPQKRMT